jgi:hypothetical protein
LVDAATYGDFIDAIVLLAARIFAALFARKLF